MAIHEALYPYLVPLASQVGGMGVLESLPEASLIMAVVHTDDVMGVTLFEPNFEITHLDLGQGYQVFDKHYQLLHHETELQNNIWGNTKNDRVWLSRARKGDWIYVRYFMTDGTERVALVMRM